MTAHVSRSIEHRVNFGDYEGVTVRVHAETDCDEGQEQRTLGKLADILSNAVEDEIVEARKFAVDTSYIHDWEG